MAARGFLHNLTDGLPDFGSQKTNSKPIKNKKMKTPPQNNLVKPESISLERISWLINEKKIMPQIAGINLEMVKMKLQDKDEGQGWNIEQCDSAEVEYKRFLQMNLQNPKSAIVPNKIMDTIWHYHILDTRAYCRDSEKTFGGYFHHYPYFGMRGGQDKTNLISSFEKTKQLYLLSFKEPMVRDEHTDCWHDCEGRCWHSCSNEDDYK